MTEAEVVSRRVEFQCAKCECRIGGSPELVLRESVEHMRSHDDLR